MQKFLCQNNSQDAGGIGVYANDNHSQCAFLSLIGVKPYFQGRGVDKSLLEAVLEIAKTKGMKKMRLEVSVENFAAISLYKKYGCIIPNFIS